MNKLAYTYIKYTIHTKKKKKFDMLFYTSVRFTTLVNEFHKLKSFGDWNINTGRPSLNATRKNIEWELMLNFGVRFMYTDS